MSHEAEKYTYRVTWSQEDQEYVGLCAEFPSLSWLAGSQRAALGGITKLVRECVLDMAKSGEVVPEPFSVRDFKGSISLRIPPHQHRRLAVEAAEQRVSLNRLISEKLGR